MMAKNEHSAHHDHLIYILLLILFVLRLTFFLSFSSKNLLEEWHFFVSENNLSKLVNKALILFLFCVSEDKLMFYFDLHLYHQVEHEFLPQHLRVKELEKSLFYDSCTYCCQYYLLYSLHNQQWSFGTRLSMQEL